jgi:DNA (cytosine-5)-methyltransferase 1
LRKREFFFIDLFAGCGGLSLGLENSGFRPILVNEISDEALATYLENRKGLKYSHFENCGVNNINEPWVWKDVHSLHKYIEDDYDRFVNITYQKHGINIKDKELDLVVGGPPCQGYSGIGHRRSYSVDRKMIPSNHLYQEMISIIDMLMPKMFLFENVKGILTAKWHQDDPESAKGDIWKSVRADFKNKLGSNYQIGWHVVYAYEYGIPQNRPRVLLVGIRNDLNWPLLANTLDSDKLLIKNEKNRAGGLIPEPTGKPPTLEEAIDDLIDDNYINGGETYCYTKSAKSDFAKRLRTNKEQKILGIGEPITEQKYSRHSLKIIQKFRHMLTTGGQIREEDKTRKFSQRLLPRVWTNGHPSITITSMPDDYIHYAQPRTMTIREWARLQTFPDWYIFKGKRTTGGMRRAGNPRADVFDREVPKYTQIGNAVPVFLAEALGNHFLSVLKQAENNFSKKSDPQ